MTTYSYSQLETLWMDAAKGTKYATAGWAALMAAIAEAESSGNSAAYNASGASGLWQILGAVHASDQSQLFSPSVNASEALAKLQSQGLGAWVTYTSGAYKQFYKAGVSPSSLPGGPGAGGSGAGNSGGVTSSLWPSQVIGFFSGIDSAAGDLWGAAAGLFSPTPWIRAGAGLLAAVLLAFGIVALARAAL
jgi:Transglycosylase SLT domain